MSQIANLKNLFHFARNPKVLLACCALIQFPFLASQQPFCSQPPLLEFYLGFAAGLFLAAFGIYQNTFSGYISALYLSGLLFYIHFYSIPVRIMEISQQSAGEIHSELVRFWLDRLSYHPTYGLQLSFTALLFFVALFCLVNKLFYKRLASM